MNAVHAITRPYQRRSGTNQRCLVTVTSGVMSRVESRSISDPLPRTSASLASSAAPFRVMIAGSAKKIGRNAGAPRTHSAMVCLLTYLPKSLTSSAIQISAEVVPAFAFGLVGAVAVGSLVPVLAIVQCLLPQDAAPLPLLSSAAFGF